VRFTNEGKKNGLELALDFLFRNFILLDSIYNAVSSPNLNATAYYYCMYFM
jgi:hypothetical protein